MPKLIERLKRMKVIRDDEAGPKVEDPDVANCKNIIAEYKKDMLARAIRMCDCGYMAKRYLATRLALDISNVHPELTKWDKHQSFYTEVNGVWFTLYASRPGKLLRLHVDCPVCDRVIPAGRISQHAKVHR